MAVVQVLEIAEGRTGDDQITAVGGVERTHQRVFKVKTDSPTDGSVVVLNSDDLPKLGSGYASSKSALRCLSRNAEPLQGEPMLWKVTCRYGNMNDKTLLPWEKQPDVQFSIQTVDRVVDVAYEATVQGTGLNKGTTGSGYYPVSGATTFFGFNRSFQRKKVAKPQIPVVNSAGDPFDPPVTDVYHSLIIKITRAERATDFDPDTILGFINSSNALPETIGGVRGEENTFRLVDIAADGDIYVDPHSQDETEFFVVSYSIEYNPEGQDKKILDCGFRTHPDPKTGEPTNITVSGQPANDPVKLNGKGGLLLATADPVYIFFRTRKLLDWKALGLPSGFTRNLMFSRRIR